MQDRDAPSQQESDSGSVAVSVLIPVLNEADHIEGTIERLRRQTFSGGLEFLLIDGDSTDGTTAIIERLAETDPRVRIIRNPRRTISSALNLGLRAARGEVIARVDARSLCEPDYLARGVERLSRGDVASVSGPALAVGRNDGSRRIALALTTPLGIGGASFRRSPEGEIEVDSGAFGVWRRETLEDAGGWDESWLVNEDGELAARIKERGGRIVCVPEMAMDYVPRDTLRELARQYWRYGLYRAKTCGAHPTSMRRSHLLPPALALTTAAGLTARPTVARPARLALAVYAAALIATGASRVAVAGPRDAAGVVPALATMHLSWGLGFLVGCVRFGPPFSAVARALAGN